MYKSIVNFCLIYLDRELYQIKKIIDSHKKERGHKKNKTKHVEKECDFLFERRFNIFPISFKKSFWKNHFELSSLNEYPEIGGHILDFGCGTGYLDYFLVKRYNKKITGIDLSPLAIKIANNLLKNESKYVRSNLNFLKKDIITDSPNQLYDSLWASHVFEHIEEPKEIFYKLKNWIKKDGKILISVPYANYYDDPDHVHHFYSKDDIRAHFGKYLKINKIDFSERDHVYRLLANFKDE